MKSYVFAVLAVVTLGLAGCGQPAQNNVAAIPYQYGPGQPGYGQPGYGYGQPYPQPYGYSYGYGVAGGNPCAMYGMVPVSNGMTMTCMPPGFNNGCGSSGAWAASGVNYTAGAQFGFCSH